MLQSTAAWRDYRPAAVDAEPKPSSCPVKATVEAWLTDQLPSTLSRRIVVARNSSFSTDLTVKALGRAYDGGERDHSIGSISFEDDGIRTAAFRQFDLPDYGTIQYSDPKFFESVERALSSMYSKWVKSREYK